MSKYAIHEDFKKMTMTNPPLFTPLLPLLNGLSKLLFYLTTRIKGVKVSTRKISGYQNTLIKANIFEREDLLDNVPCIVPRRRIRIFR